MRRKLKGLQSDEGPTGEAQKSGRYIELLAQSDREKSVAPGSLEQEDI